MTPEERRRRWSETTDAMRDHTLPMVTPLASRVGTHDKLEGTGTYVLREGQHWVMTCEHVARRPGLQHRFFDLPDLHRIREPFVYEREPIDAAWSIIPPEVWTGIAHQAEAVGYERFALKHQPVHPSETLFYRGFSGENSTFDLVKKFQANRTFYGTQEKQVEHPHPMYFEIPFEPERASFTDGTDAEARANSKFTDPGGFSGSLVWNTRRFECHRANVEWTPEQAVVTGLLKGWDPATQSLIVLRVEHLRAVFQRHIGTGSGDAPNG